MKQNNHKVITVGQSPATWDRTHPRNLLQMTVKVNQGVNPRVLNTHQLHPVTQIMSNQISGLISRYVTNSTPQDTTQTNKHAILRATAATRSGHCPELLSGKGATDQGATSAAMSYSRRRDAATTNVTAGGPTLRRTATPQTHATRTATSAVSIPPDEFTSALG